METKDALDPKDFAEFESTAKVGLIATVSPDGLPHLTLITTLQAKTPKQLMWGPVLQWWVCAARDVVREGLVHPANPARPN